MDDKQKIHLLAILSINAITGDISRISQKDNNDFLTKSKEWWSYFESHNIFSRIKKHFYNDNEYKKFIKDFMHNIIYLRNLYVHYYDNKNDKAKIEEFNCFEKTYEFKINSKKHYGVEKINFKQILADHILSISNVAMELKDNSKDKILHLIFLRIISSKYTIDRIIKYFKEKNKDIEKSFFNILTQKNIYYLNLNKIVIKKESEKAFKKPKSNFLSSILWHKINREPISKKIISKAILLIINKKEKIEYEVLKNNSDNNYKNIFFAYNENIEDYLEKSQLGVFKINQNKIIDNMFFLNIKNKKIIINHKYLTNLILNHQFDNSKIISNIYENINNTKKPKKWEIKYEIKIKKYIENIVKLFTKNKSPEAINMLLKTIWKYEFKKNKNSNDKRFLKFSEYFLQKDKKRQLISVIYKEKNNNQNYKEFLKSFNEYNNQYYHLDFSSRTNFKQQLLEKVQKLLEKEKSIIGKKVNNKNNVQKLIIVTDNDDKVSNFKFLKIPLTKETKTKIHEELKNKLDNLSKSQIKWNLIVNIVIKNLSNTKITPNLNSEVVKKFKNQFSNEFHQLNINNYDGKNNDDESINSNGINRHIYHTLLYENIYKLIQKNNEHKKHKESLKIYEKYENIEFDKIIEYITNSNDKTNEIRNLFMHRDKISKENIEWIKKLIQ